MTICKIQQFKPAPNNYAEHFIMVELDNGVCGWGSAFLPGYEKAISVYLNQLADVLVGTNAFNIENWFSEHVIPRMCNGGYALTAAAGGIEMAIWDAISRSLKLPLHMLLGGKIQQPLNMTNPSKSYVIYRDTKKRNGLLNGIGISLVGWDSCCETVEEFAQKAIEMIDQGFFSLRMKPLRTGSKSIIRMQQINLQGIIDIVEAVSTAIGKRAELLIDFECALNYDQALWIGRRLSTYHIAGMVDPLQQNDPMLYQKMIRLCNTPIILGRGVGCRQNLSSLFENKICSIFDINPTICGGVHEMRKIINAAEAYYVDFQINAPYSLLATVAGAHAAVTVNGNKRIVMDVSMLDQTGKLYDDPLIVENGMLFLKDDAPGLGFLPKTNFLTEM